MASYCYSPPPRRNNKYDVFVSFRGEDTRDNFTSHLYSALSQKSIQTFIDDRHNRGDEISQSLVHAIEASTISVIIFSEGYASSRWCLDELVKILQCKREYAQIVLPVFYRVDPSHVRWQTGSFGDSFSNLEERFKENSAKLQTWRNALKEAASLSGFHSQNIRPESKLIKEVVNQVLKRLAEVSPCNNKNQLVGVESRVEEIESLLGAKSEDVYALGIWGIGGIGKTTIARAVFYKISSNFEGSCFLQNVREESQRPGGLACLQQKLLSELLQDDTVIPDIALSFRRLSRKKVLIVLDDVTCFKQIKSLIGSLQWYMAESRIIITTRNQQVLRNCCVNKKYEMKELGDDHALELFSRHAFKQNNPHIGFEELSSRVIQYAQGVPLAIEILGCFLFEKEKQFWESAINKLKRIPDMEIQKVLEISFDGLDDEEKNIFLDIACFFKWKNKDFVIKFLNACGFTAQVGISGLVDKSLICIHGNNITMHDLLQEMGREIVRQESTNDPGKRSRLWHHEDIVKVLTSNTGTEAIEGICLDMSKAKEIHLNPDTFTKMRKLRFLKFYCSINGENKCKASDFQGPVFAEVRYFHWHGYPLKSLPSNIHPDKLVLLEMPRSNIQQLWDGVQQRRGKLKQIIISACNFFTKTPNPSLSQHLSTLVILNLRDCRSLKSLPAGIHLEFLKELDLSGCTKLKRLPEVSSAGNIEEILLNGTAIEELPSSIECLYKLLRLDLEDCKSLKSLPSGLCKLKSLKYLTLNGCSNLQRLPDELGNLEALWSLHAIGTAIGEVPSSIFCLSNVDLLSFQRSRGHKKMGLSLPVTLSLDGLHTLTFLNLSDCGITQLPENIGQLSSIEDLDLEKNNFERIPESIIQLSKLGRLYLRYCERLQSLPKLPCKLHELDAHHCTALESLSGLFSSYEACTQYFDLSYNYKLDGNEIRGILEGALQEIQLLATARGKEIYYSQKYPLLGRVFLPGNEIPVWFSFQSMKSSITLMMPPGWFSDKKVLGFAFSAIVSFGDHHAREKRWFELFCEFKVKPKDSHVIQRFMGMVDYVELDHLLLGYYFFDDQDLNGFWKCNCIIEAVQFFFKEDFYRSERLECCPVKKCGIHLLYAPDSTKSTEDLSGFFYHKHEEEPHPKKLKYS